MEKLVPRIRKIAARIAYTASKRQQLARFLRDAEPETKLFKKTVSDKLDDLKIVAVDGGLGKKSLHGLDCVLVRAVGVCFHYKSGKLEKVEYWPSKNPLPIPHVFEALSDLDWAYFASVTRLKEEIDTALASLEHFRPDILLLDGSIAPHYSDKPSRNSAVYKAYQELLETYKKLYSRSQENGTILAGIVEDSRNTAFCELIKQDVFPAIRRRPAPELAELLGKTRDTNLLYLLLEKGERTLAFKYTTSPSEHPVLRDFGHLGENIQSFYLKTAQYDRPIKVDSLSPDIEKLASVMLAISGQHPDYGIPAPLIEADNVARLSEQEMENFYSQILSIVGNIPSTMKLRREQRPF